MDHQDELQRSRERFIDALGQQSAFWGVGKITGQLFAALYLAKEPLTLDQLAESLAVSKGHVSVAIRTLEQLGMVRRHLPRGERKIFFEAETDFWKISRRVLERRQKPEFDQSFQVLRESIAEARSAEPNEERDFVLERLEHLQSFYDDLDALVAVMLRLDPKRFATMARWFAKQRTDDGEG